MLLKAQKTGRTHRAKNLPCQDRCMTYSDGEALVLVVADGHGAGASDGADGGDADE